MHYLQTPPDQSVLVIKHATVQERPIQILINRVTFFYQFRDKQKKYHKVASVSNTLPLKVYVKTARKLRQ